MAINKFTTLLDLARQAKILTGETATFDGKISSGIPFSGYPTGVDTATTVSLGVISTQYAVFSGGTGTTIFDVSNIYSPNYDPSFAAFSATTWSNPVFSANTSGLTLPITILSADTQIIGPFWTLTQTGYTGEFIIGTQYTGYSVTYSFGSVATTPSPNTFSGLTIASQEIFSAGTLDYKGPLDYLYSAEDATIKGRLTTDKLTIQNGASSATTNYLLTQFDDTGKAEWTSPSIVLSGLTIWTAGTGTNSAVLGGTGGYAGYASVAAGEGVSATTNYSFAEGFYTLADGSRSHAEGSQTQALGGSSHAEGSYTIASGSTSHSEGDSTIAGGVSSHAEGDSSIAIGIASHAEGYFTLSSGDFSHAEGYLTQSLSENSHAEGKETITSGKHAHAEGYGSMATNEASHAEGYFTLSSGDYSHAEGVNTIAGGVSSHAEGDSSIASGTTSHAEGYQSTASGYASHAEGSFTTASGNQSHAEGYQTNASGPASHAEGSSTTASGDSSHTEGGSTIAYGDYSHAEGSSTIASGTTSHAEGYQSTASGYASHAEGNGTLASGDYSHAEGYSGSWGVTEGRGHGSHAEGAGTLASGFVSHAEGERTIASGASSHAEGSNTTAGGYNSHAEGNLTSASNDSSHAGGYNSIASGVYSFVHGENSIATNTNTIVFGKNITGTTSETLYTNNLIIDNQDGLFTSKLGINTSSPQYVIDANGNSARLLLADTYTGADAPFKGFVFSGNSNNVPQIAASTSNISGGFGLALQMGVLGNNITPTSSTQLLGTLGDTYLVSSQQTNNLNIVNRNGGSGTNHIRMYAGVNSVTAAPKSDFHIQGDGVTIGYIGINNDNPLYRLHIVDTNSNLYFDSSSTSSGGEFSISGGTNVPRIMSQIPPYLTNPSAAGGFGMRAWDDSLFPGYGKPGDLHFYASNGVNGLNIINQGPGATTENYIRFYAGDDADGTTPDIHIQGSGTTKSYVGIGTINPSEKLDVNGKTKTINFQMTSGATAGYVLTSDSSGNASWQSVSGGTGGVPESTTATTTTINFTGQTIYYNATTPGTGNITENLTGSKLGLIQKIYHNDVAEPTYPAGWVLMGDAIYFTSTLNIIYAEWAFGSRVEYWYVQEQ